MLVRRRYAGAMEASTGYLWPSDKETALTNNRSAILNVKSLQKRLRNLLKFQGFYLTSRYNVIYS